MSSPRKPTRSCSDRPSRSTDHAATTSILPRTPRFKSRSAHFSSRPGDRGQLAWNSGRLSRPLAPLTPLSANWSTMTHPFRRPIASVSAWRWLSAVCQVVKARKSAVLDGSFRRGFRYRGSRWPPLIGHRMRPPASGAIIVRFQPVRSPQRLDPDLTLSTRR